MDVAVMTAEFDAVVTHGNRAQYKTDALVSTIPPMTGEELRDRLVQDIEDLILNAYRYGTTVQVRISVAPTGR